MDNWYNESTDKSTWYKTGSVESDSEWTTYGPAGPAGRERTTAPDKRCSEAADRKRMTARIIGLAVLIGVIAAGTVIARLGGPSWSFSFSKTGTESGSDSDFGSFTYGIPSGDVPAEEMPDDFNEFFSNYFTDSEVSETDVRIEKCDVSGPFSISLRAPKSDELSLQELYRKCSDSIVSIIGYKEGIAGYNWGTGVTVSADGLILTNTHVINDCDSCEVACSDGRRFDAKLVGADAISDLALLKIEADGLTPAEFGENADLAVGDKVAAIGNPLGDAFSGTLTNGIISAIERDVTYNGRSMSLLQTNTALNEGNSGGALFNMYGQVIGITNMKMMSAYSSIEGIGFAIPSSTVMSVVNSIVKYGEVRGRPSIGITVGAIPSNAQEFYDMPEGLYISSVSAGSDAEKKGILPGDVLTEVDGVHVDNVDMVNGMKNEKNVGDTMTFSIWRNGEKMEFTVSLVDTNDIYG